MKWKEPKWAKRRRLANEVRTIARLFEWRKQARIALITNVIWITLVALGAAWQPLFQPNWTWWLGGLTAQTGYLLYVVFSILLMLGLRRLFVPSVHLTPSRIESTFVQILLKEQQQIRWRIAFLDAGHAALVLLMHSKRRRGTTFIGLSDDVDVRKFVALLRVARLRAIRRARKGKQRRGRVDASA